MKIGQQPDIQPTTGVQALSPASAKAGQDQVASTRGDRKTPGVGVSVSELARALEQTGASGDADIDMEKVNAVRQAIEQNTYRVNPEAIADKLLANAQEMLNRTLS